jgi:hypothetical protein
MADITAPNPIEIPPVPAVTYDLWVIPEFSVEWRRPNDPMQCRAVFQCARRVDGQLEFGPVRKGFFVDNLWDMAAEDAEVASVLTSLIAVLTKKATEQGAI